MAITKASIGVVSSSPGPGIVGSINASQLINTAPISTMPAGSLVGFAKYEDHPANDNYVIVSADTEYQTAVSITYTPKFSNSLLLIHAEHQVRIIAAVGATLGIKRDGVYINPSANNQSLIFVYKGDSVNHHYQMACETVVTANTTNPTTFTLFFKPYGGTGEVNNGWGNRFMRIMEIKQ